LTFVQINSVKFDQIRLSQCWSNFGWACSCRIRSSWPYPKFGCTQPRLPDWIYSS